MTRFMDIFLRYGKFGGKFNVVCSVRCVSKVISIALITLIGHI